MNTDNEAGLLFRWLSHNGCCMMTANVIETAQDVIIATHSDNGFSGDFAGEVLTRIAYSNRLVRSFAMSGKYTL